MTYMKLVARESKRHLMKPDQLEQGTTLCGCVVTRMLGWHPVSALEGDECQKCAELAFADATANDTSEKNLAQKGRAVIAQS